MSFKNKCLILSILVISANSVNVNAGLIAGTAGGKNVVYSTLGNVTWTGDANLLGTLQSSQGYSNVINAIIAASPTVNSVPSTYDTPPNSGTRSITTADFSSTNLGTVSWWGAQAFINYLNSTGYAGSNQWALPFAGTNPVGADFVQTADGQLDTLYFSELGGVALSPIPNTNNITNEQSSHAYWMTEASGFSGRAWSLFTDSAGGFHDISNKNYLNISVWAVAPGILTNVPIPGGIWLFGSALVSGIGWKRKYRVIKI